MPKTILDLVTQKSDRLQGLKNAPNDPDLRKEADDLAKLATRAIMEGRFSLAWREYMLQFVDVEPAPFNSSQLARLLANDDTFGDETMSRRRAYLLGNAICGADSTGTIMLALGVNTVDDGL